jgi:hypothetical protein
METGALSGGGGDEGEESSPPNRPQLRAESLRASERVSDLGFDASAAARPLGLHAQPQTAGWARPHALAPWPCQPI